MPSKVDANDAAAMLGPEEFKKLIREGVEKSMMDEVEKLFPSVADLYSLWRGQRQRPTIIEGLLRGGETMNIIAPPKVGKSWLVYHFALAIASGGNLLNYPKWGTNKGKVLIIDNELFPDTLACRIPDIVRAKKMDPDVLLDVHVHAMRGNLKPIDQLGELVERARALEPRLIVFDALYRMMPTGHSENDNAQMTQIYNTLDYYASSLQNCAIVVIHHASKGNQATKDVTDMGSGAGSQSRAADAHMVIRPHEKENHFVFEGKTRDFATPDKLVLEWDYPQWRPRPEENPNSLANSLSKARKPKLESMNNAVFQTYLYSDRVVTRKELIQSMRNREGISRANAEALVEQIMSKNGILMEDLKIVGSKDCHDFTAHYTQGGGIAFQLRLPD